MEEGGGVATKSDSCNIVHVLDRRTFQADFVTLRMGQTREDST